MDDDVLFLSHTGQPGGAELALQRYLAATAQPGRLLSLEPGPAWAPLTTSRETICLEARGHLDSLQALRRNLRERPPRQIVANSMRAAFVAALTKSSSTELIYWVRDGLIDSAMSRLATGLTKFVTAPRTARYLANSEWTASTIRAAVPGAQIRVVPSMSGVSAESIRSCTPRLRPSTGTMRLLYVGRIAAWKGPHLAVHAVSELRKNGYDATLTIAGDALFGESEYQRSLDRLIARSNLGEAVRRTGHVEDVGSLMDAHDILVHCSIKPEPFGQVIIQAMGRGVPVVAPDVGGPSEILAGGRWGLRYEPGNADAIARAVRLLDAPDAYLKFSRLGLSRALAYSDEVALGATDRALRGSD